MYLRKRAGIPLKESMFEKFGIENNYQIAF